MRYLIEEISQRKQGQMHEISRRDISAKTAGKPWDISRRYLNRNSRKTVGNHEISHQGDISAILGLKAWEISSRNLCKMRVKSGRNLSRREISANLARKSWEISSETAENPKLRSWVHASVFVRSRSKVHHFNALDWRFKTMHFLSNSA